MEPWEPSCVYCSPVTGDLLVGTVRHNKYTGKITRYNSTGQHVKTIQQYLQGHELYNRPIFVTENRNGDVVVTDLTKSAVVVTDHGGRHRFSYTGSASEIPFTPFALCTDAFSHILVYDNYADAVQMIDKDGHFLSVLLSTKELGINLAQCLSYDNRTHHLWVGSSNDTLSVFRYINRVDIRTD
ncbi:uncharacterized protein LOC133178807 [Saccostrea echinata]|uniref:uncharacterized protein LOC133178807 n=1 Tax=Saccostrea echinata TaxID=191078 RepID=UPI002A7F8949|nr:uncharacterized protein LOC133178807 [Saccostrea echinata]